MRNNIGKGQKKSCNQCCQKTAKSLDNVKRYWEMADESFDNFSKISQTFQKNSNFFLRIPTSEIFQIFPKYSKLFFVAFVSLLHYLGIGKRPAVVQIKNLLTLVWKMEKAIVIQLMIVILDLFVKSVTPLDLGK